VQNYYENVLQEIPINCYFYPIGLINSGDKFLFADYFFTTKVTKGFHKGFYFIDLHAEVRFSKEAVSKVFLTQRHKDFSQSSQRINPSKRELCVPCVNPLRTLR